MKPVKFDPRYLPYMGALVQSVLFGIAGYRYFNAGAWGAVAGVGVGLVVNFSIATASSKIADIAQKRQAMAKASLVSLMILSPASIALSFFAPAAVITAIVWAMDVDVAIVLTGAIVGKGLVKQDETTMATTTKPGRKPRKVAETVAETPVQVVETVAKPGRKPITDAELVAFFSGNPDATNADAARHFNVSHTAIGKRAGKLFGVKKEVSK